jgi:hypothetical protein
MKLRDGFVICSTGDEQIMVDTGSRFRGMVRLNSTAAFIVECLGRDMTRDMLLAKLEEKYDAPRPVLEGDLDRVLESLTKIGALDA